MARFLHPDVVVIFPDTEVLVGVDALRAYIDGMLHAEDPLVESFTPSPVVELRALSADTAFSQGRLNDAYVLTDGSAFHLDSVFTATLVRMPDGPEETGGFVLRSLHASADAFDNPVTRMIVSRAVAWTAVIAGVVGLLLGAALGFGIRRRKA